ncbi:MAG TPA: hypothetical protein VGM39_09655 [Kofleriaceae bacterium]|jgi:hypothetical protein
MRSFLFATLLLGAACSIPAQADQVGPNPPQPAIAMSGPRTALAIADAKIRAPYDVQIIRENGETLPTYSQRGRFYVQGNAGERYVVRVVNPTGNRIEAVVSIDGLDVVDGEDGDLHKRGYVVPPYGETRIEGFRTSTDDVATFRFSSVDGSYAGKQGKARNVGVIAVALFEEQGAPAEQQIIVGDAKGGKDKNTEGGFRPPYDYEDDLAPNAAPPAPTTTASRDTGRAGGGAPAKAEKKAAAEPTARPTSSRPAPAPAGAQRRMLDESADEADYAPTQEEAPKTERLGLGTEFGEQRQSAASFTKFERATDRPIAIAELRYNDMAGLTALGINVQPLPDQGEIMTRETADPFPGDTRFSSRP